MKSKPSVNVTLMVLKMVWTPAYLVTTVTKSSFRAKVISENYIWVNIIWNRQYGFCNFKDPEWISLWSWQRRLQGMRGRSLALRHFRKPWRRNSNTLSNSLPSVTWRELRLPRQPVMWAKWSRSLRYWEKARSRLDPAMSSVICLFRFYQVRNNW